MSKILLVEDDNNLREIYEARLQAEGYDIVSARDGEEALTVAMKERPDLIISDVMMPKISGFDMLDIIRSTEETKNVKVIMMTALSQAEDKARAEKLGADRYLVKSQVTLEDVAKVAREVLSGDTAAPVQASTVSEPASSTPNPTPSAVQEDITTAAPVQAADPAPVVAATPDEVPPAAPVTPADEQTNTAATATPVVEEPVQPTQTPEPTAAANPAMTAIAPADPVASEDTSTQSSSGDAEQDAIATQIESFIESKKTAPEPAPEVEPKEETAAIAPAAIIEPAKEETPTETDASQGSKKVIQPLSDPTASKGPDLDSLLQKESEKEEMAAIAKGLATATATEPVTEPATDVKISEDGSLEVKAPPAEQSVQPEIATSGTNIDGVVQAPAAPKAPTSGVDPNAISL